MCINPSYVWIERGPKYEQQPVPCRQCWRCKSNRVNDFIGRAMAEASVSQHVCCITLTYAPRDDLADKVVTPVHFQNFMKQMRNAGHKIRYLVAGEYGELKDRAHFHAVLFFTHLAPLPDGAKAPRYEPENIRFYDQFGAFCGQIPQMEMVHIREWPHGHVQVDWSIDERSIRYVCEYVTVNKKTGWLSMSKKPPLGAGWFQEKAQLAVDLGVMPSSFNYLPPGGSTEKPYMMTGATRRDYLKTISDALQRPDTSLNEWVLKSLEKVRKWAFLRDCPDEGIEAFTARMREELEPRYLAGARSASSAELLHLLAEAGIFGDAQPENGIWAKCGNYWRLIDAQKEPEQYARALAARS